MQSDEAIEKIKKQIEGIAALRAKPRFSPEFKKWYRETVVLLQRIFGKEGYQVSDFGDINFLYRGMHRVGDQEPFDRRYRAALEEAAAILTSIFEEVEEYGLESAENTFAPLGAVDVLVKRFHTVVRQLRVRHEQRQTLDVGDEYDVQDLFHALLRLFFKDIRTEEWTTQLRWDMLSDGFSFAKRRDCCRGEENAKGAERKGHRRPAFGRYRSLRGAPVLQDAGLLCL